MLYFCMSTIAGIESNRRLTHSFLLSSVTDLICCSGWVLDILQTEHRSVPGSFYVENCGILYFLEKRTSSGLTVCGPHYLWGGQLWDRAVVVIEVGISYPRKDSFHNLIIGIQSHFFKISSFHFTLLSLSISENLAARQASKSEKHI